MTSFISTSISSSPFLSGSPPDLHNPSLFQTRLDLFNTPRQRSSHVLPLKCKTSGTHHDTEPEPQISTSFSSTPLSADNFTYKLCAGIGGIGLLETAYLTYLKLTNSEAFCPIGGGTCSDVLKSDYALVFGMPLPLIGMAAYSLVATLGLSLTEKKFPFGINESDARFTLLGITTSMAAASSYFLYILSSEFSLSSCSYCLISALLSFTMFFITIRDFELQELQKVVGQQICIISLVIAALNKSYSSIEPASTANIELPYFTTEITTPSSPFAMSLARHLHSVGAKMYGAFWCSHCLEQKQLFGHEAAKVLDYVECFPNGFKKGTIMEKACIDAKVEGFPSWVINGQLLSGEQELSELGRVSGFNESAQPN